MWVKFLSVLLLLLCAVWITSSAHGRENETMKKYTFNEAFNIKRGQWVELEDGLKIQFLAHSHKMVMAGGPPSPLIITMNYKLNGNENQQRHYVYSDENYLLAWNWNHYSFHIKSHEYGQSMNLTIRKDGP